LVTASPCGSFASRLVLAHTLVHPRGDAPFPPTPASSPMLLLSARTWRISTSRTLGPWAGDCESGWPRDGNSDAAQRPGEVSLENKAKWGTSTKPVTCWVYERLLEQRRGSACNTTGLSQGNRDRSTPKKHIQANGGMEIRGEGKKKV